MLQSYLGIFFSKDSFYSFYLYSNSQILIICFGLRPVHMVSVVILTITKILAYKIHFL